MKNMSRAFSLVEHLVPLCAISIILSFTYAIFFGVPYVGFNFNPSNGEVIEVLVEASFPETLQPKDQILKIGSVLWESYRSNARQMFFDGYKPGQIVGIQVIRNGKNLSIPWILPGPNPEEFQGRLINMWLLAYVFWLAGTAALLIVRPKDTRWYLLIAFNYLTAIWLITGNLSMWHAWDSAILLRMAFWLSVPVYLHLHWILPHPLGKIPSTVVWICYSAAVMLAVLEWFQFLPRNTYHLGVILTILGVLSLLVFHLAKQPPHRRSVWLLIVSLLTALLPMVVLSAFRVLTGYPSYGGGALLTLPLIPITYFYIIYRHQLGALEIRANRFISAYIFLIVLGTVLAATIPVLSTKILSRDVLIAFNIVSSLITGLIAILGYSRFEKLVNQRLLGAPLQSSQLLETYSSLIAVSLETSEINHLLKHEILPSLLVRQSALLLEEDGHLLLIYADGIESTQIPSDNAIPQLDQLDGKYSLSPLLDNRYSWLHLCFTLQTNGKRVGFWLLGRKDPDDFYSQSEIALLRAIADQTAIALMNAAQAERLRLLHQANIERYEDERSSLARALHDDVLNQLAALAMNSDIINIPSFPEKHQLVMNNLRRMVSSLRPAALVLGLWESLDELTDELSERVNHQVTFSMVIPHSATRYNPKVEEHIYRIVQQACENALHHSQAKLICVSGVLETDTINITVEDNGIGMPGQKSPDFNMLLAKKHFGLAGMFERAEIIGASLEIKTTEGVGTNIRVNWSAAV